MSDFLPAFERMLANEGGYLLHKVAGDTGGLTYAGIARNKNPHWPGWAAIDRGETPASQLVRLFYVEEFWRPVAGDAITHQRVAENLFDFGVNAGPRTAVKLAQIIVGATPDGVAGPKTIAALNAMDPELFVARYAIAKLARYHGICQRDPVQRKFLMGWVARTLKEAA